MVMIKNMTELTLKDLWQEVKGEDDLVGRGKGINVKGGKEAIIRSDVGRDS